MTKRADGEGSIYHRGHGKDGRDLGWAAYAWIETPSGKRRREYVYGKERETCHAKWIELLARAAKGPVSVGGVTVGKFLSDWLEEVIRPNREPLTYATYETFVRLHITPWVGRHQLVNLRPRQLQTWLNDLGKRCQCCSRGIDEARPVGKRKCCAIEQCCEKVLADRTISDIRNCLRSALSQAIMEELITSNVAKMVRLSSGRRRRKVAWSSDEARQFLEHVRPTPLYAAFILVLIMGLRKGEVLGLTWADLDLEEGELVPRNQLQRVGGNLLHKRVKTEESENALPMPELCVAALKVRKARQDADQENAGEAWQDKLGLVFTSRYGAPIEPRNFNRYFDGHMERAGVNRITVHDARRTCASLLVDLDVHPRVIMAILRHADVKVTMEVYAQASSKATREALKRLGDSLG